MAGKAPSRRKRPRKKHAKGVIWSATRDRRSKGESVKNSWQANFKVKRDFAYDIDVRPLVAHVSVGLAEHFRDQVRAGKQASGFGEQRRVNAATKAMSGDRVTDKAGGRTGYGADRWWLGQLRGSSTKAFRYVKPYGGSDGPELKVPSTIGRDVLLNILLKKGVDFQSVKGTAQKRIWELFDEYLKTCVGDKPGIGPVDGSETLLPEADDWTGDGEDSGASE